MMLLDALVERRIREAQERGDFDDLPGAGAPLQWDDDALIPEELRIVHRVLKNAGLTPPEIAGHAEIRNLEHRLTATSQSNERARITARIRFLLCRVSIARNRASPHVEAAYLEKMAGALLERQRRAESGDDARA